MSVVETAHFLLIMSPLYVIIALLLAVVFTWKPSPLFYLVFFCAMLISNRAFKYAYLLLVGEQHAFRPTSCPLPNSDGDCEQCSILPKWDRLLNGDNQIGMPSGHTQSMCMLATSWTLYALRYVSNFWHRVVSSVFFWLWAAAVAYQRIASRCHSPTQVASGAIVGVVMGYFAHSMMGRHNIISA
jgi:membrane-associated phospholipid phosphatase